MVQLCQMFMPSGAKRQNLILQSASLAVGTADLFFKKGNEIKFLTQTNYTRRTPDEGSPSFFALQRNSPSPAFREG